MNPRTLAVCAVVPALAAGLLAVFAPVAAASDTVTRTVSFEHKCRVDGATDWDSSFSDNMEVTAPHVRASRRTVHSEIASRHHA